VREKKSVTHHPSRVDWSAKDAVFREVDKPGWLNKGQFHPGSSCLLSGSYETDATKPSMTYCVRERHYGGTVNSEGLGTGGDRGHVGTEQSVQAGVYMRYYTSIPFGDPGPRRCQIE
jgi:hypothetical protein